MRRAEGGVGSGHLHAATTAATTAATRHLGGLVVGQGVDLAGVGRLGLAHFGRRVPQATHFGAPGNAGPKEGVLRGHGDCASPW